MLVYFNRYKSKENVKMFYMVFTENNLKLNIIHNKKIKNIQIIL